MKAIIQHQILRLAKIYVSRPVCEENMAFHIRVGNLQRQAIEAKKAIGKKKFRVLSPDGFDIEMNGEYAGMKAARAAVQDFVKRFERQGYYSTANRQRIPLSDIPRNCSIIPA